MAGIAGKVCKTLLKNKKEKPLGDQRLNLQF